MDFLVVRLTGRANNEAIESEYSTSKLTLGADGLVELPGIRSLLTLESKGGGLGFALAKGELSLNGESKKSGVFNPGDVIECQGYTIECVQAPAGFDAAIRISGGQEAPVIPPENLEFERAAWGLRSSSWFLVAVVAIVFLAIPLAGVFDKNLAQQLRETPLPDDALWSSGPLASAHRTVGIADDCDSCHEKPFVMVEDSSCLQCHRNISEHVDLNIHDPELFAGERCASCHREHNEPAMIVSRDNGMCTDCHSDAMQWEKPGWNHMQSVSAFTDEGHPEFRYSFLRPKGPNGAHGWETERAALDENPQETSNLKFNHAVHLDVDKVQDEGTGEALVCESCHQVEQAGEHFVPVTMDNNCRSCHSLSFDGIWPDLELPHGDLRAALVAMEAHYIREFTDPEFRKARAPRPQRRVPGKRFDAATCEGDGLSCGRDEALKEAQYQLAESGCVTCYEVTDTSASNLLDRWTIAPVRIATDWLPASRFDHVAHMALDQSKDTPELCMECHEANGSEVSTDVLMPEEGICLECHSEDHNDSELGCIGCHGFHPKAGFPAVDARLHDMLKTALVKPEA